MSDSRAVRAQGLPLAGLSGRNITILLFAIASFFYWIALFLYMPTLPTYIQTKTNDLALVGVVLSMYGLWQAIIRLPLGIVSDWVGKRQIFILGGLALCAFGTWLTGVAQSVELMIVGRAVVGLAAGTWVPMVVAFSGLFAPKEAVRASTTLMLCGSLGRLLATLSTGWLNDLGGYSLAFFLAAGAAIAAALVIAPVREERRAPKVPSFPDIWRLFLRRDVLLPTLLNTISQHANWGSTFGFVPILAKQLGASGVMQSALMAFNLAIVVAGNLAATLIVKRTGSKRLSYASFGALAIGVAGCAFAPNLAVLFVAQFFIGLAQGIGYPVLMGMSIEHVSEEERATAMGIHQSVYAIGMFSGPALSGVLAKACGVRPMFAVTAALTAVIGLAVTYLVKERA